MFHTTYLGQLHERIDAGPLPDLDQGQYDALRDGLQSAEQTGLHPQQFDPSLAGYLLPARNASAYGYSVAFLVTSGLEVLGLIVVAWLVRRPPATLDDPMVREPSTDDPDRDPDLGRRRQGG